MSSVSPFLLFFAIVLLINSAFGTPCGSPKTSQHGPNYRSWQVSIVYDGQQDQFNPLQCSGAILNDRFVITAAHCLHDLNGDPVPLPMLQIQSVNNLAIRRSIARVYHPKKFNVERLDDDVVLLKLDRPFLFNSYVSPICFNSTKLVSPEIYALDVSHLEPESELNVVDFSTLPTANCNVINSEIFDATFGNSLCVGEFDASQTYHRKAGMALMIRANDTLYIGGVVLYTTGSSQGNISFAGGINLEPYAVWIDTTINRHLRLSVSEQKCQEYSAVAATKEVTMWIPTVVLLDESFNIFMPLCFANFISEHFLLTAAKCKSATSNKFNQLINCLWTEEDTPVKFVAQVKHAIGYHMEDYFRAEYVPTKPIKLVDIKHCSVIESMRIQSAPGDVVAVKKGNETIRRIIGLSTKGLRDKVPAVPDHFSSQTKIRRFEAESPTRIEWTPTTVDKKNTQQMNELVSIYFHNHRREQDRIAIVVKRNGLLTLKMDLCKIPVKMDVHHGARRLNRDRVRDSNRTAQYAIGW
ncbi:conserved hypothetical protein [Culex quinquefasciatus]|uniref:Peptidase S1 domain-containing protein n=1 Tax=Culex quinquefasciatus TaxID=7176 RepID=B0W7W3_CULQU|nr:conserved hypothetical protein [Culex quinquefasciatus]|eukprot:XP_001844797.1 conserved hypothetical protein [Culex quinquefasciatus]